MILANYTSNVLPYYIKSNNFNSANLIGLIGMKISGTIKDNYTSSFNTQMGIHLINSSPNLYQNTIASKNVALHLVGHCYPNLAPYFYNNQAIWTGGKNRLSSQFNDNIQLASPGNVYTNFGENRFHVFDTTNSSYHIYGWVDTSVTSYNAINNCWYPDGIAKIYLRRNGTTTPIQTITGITTIDCAHEIDPNGWEIDYLGNGIYDSVKMSMDNSGQIPSAEEILKEQGNQYLENSFFMDAISTYKNLIDNYPNYYYLPKTAIQLYSCYEYLDISPLQSQRNILYGNLKIYLEAKLNSNDYKNEEFTDICYENITMCEANMINYDAASNNYEFIALYHPDPDVRLTASWNYAEVQALINSGNGGGERDLGLGISLASRSGDLELNKLKEINEIKRIDDIVSNDPIMSKMKESYGKIKTVRKENMKKEINIESNTMQTSQTVNNDLRTSVEFDKIKEDKAKRNIFELKNLSPENLEKRRIEDLLLTSKSFKNESDNNEIVNLPLQFNLSQNYPNPFNPKTKINYELRFANYVSIIVYDVLGKEVGSLVNQKQNAGRYEIEFDGSNFSSGVYFYKLTTDDFTSVKRMILLK